MASFLHLSCFLRWLLKAIHKILGIEVWMHIAFKPVIIAKQIWAHFLDIFLHYEKRNIVCDFTSFFLRSKKVLFSSKNCMDVILLCGVAKS